MTSLRTWWVIGLLALPLVGCATADHASRPSSLTPGMTKKYITPGKTTQTEVLEIFGPPNIVTHKDGSEVWTYDKISHDVTSSGGYLTILLAGYDRRRTRTEQRSILLMIYFDRNDRVTDYRLNATHF